MSPDKNSPVVAVDVWYHVGSKNEEPSRTGFAHLFEHMMFQGSAHVRKAEHMRYIEQAGGTFNGSTTWDRTNYFETVPSNHLELALWLESDRMTSLDISRENLNDQREVVKEERRFRVDNRPYGTSWEGIFSLAFRTHPYHWPVADWIRQLSRAIGRAESLAHFHTFFDNAGDVNTYMERFLSVTPAQIREVAEKYLDRDDSVVVYYLAKDDKQQ